jgi:hypothetical protein
MSVLAIGYGYWLAFIVTSIFPFVWLVQFGAWCLLGVSWCHSEF